MFVVPIGRTPSVPPIHAVVHPYLLTLTYSGPTPIRRIIMHERFLRRGYRLSPTVSYQTRTYTKIVPFHLIQKKPKSE